MSEDEERERDGQREGEREAGKEARREEGRERERDKTERGENVFAVLCVGVCGICSGKDVAGERGMQGERNSIGEDSPISSLRASVRSADAWEDN